ncbi:Dabb family protein [Ensifer sp. 22521]|uniref:Dabb family protein n=1 Tax=unclassified Ensifer TaxID=2633371 RepID=UPI003CF437BA
MHRVIKHIVMWNIRGENEEERNASALDLKARFERLIGQIPGLITLEIGIDISRQSFACDAVLYSEFVDRASLAAYAEHPAHLRIRKELEGVRTARYQVDYAV